MVWNYQIFFDIFVTRKLTDDENGQNDTGSSYA